MVNSGRVADRVDRQDTRGTKWQFRYSGSEVFFTLNVNVAVLYTMRWHTGSQCSVHSNAFESERPQLLRTVRTALTLACSMVDSRLDYCNSLLNGALASTMNKLQRAQNTAVRTVLNSCGRSDSKALLRTLHWLPVCQRIVYKTALLTFKVKKTSLPDYLNCHLVPRTSSWSTRSATLPLLTILSSKTEFARRSFPYVAPNTWNRPPVNVITCDNLSSFKKRLKTYLFEQHYM